MAVLEISKILLISLLFYIENIAMWVKCENEYATSLVLKSLKNLEPLFRNFVTARSDRLRLCNLVYM